MQRHLVSHYNGAAAQRQGGCPIRGMSLFCLTCAWRTWRCRAKRATFQCDRFQETFIYHHPFHRFMKSSRIDSQNMYEVLKDFPKQIEQAYALGKDIIPKPFDRIIVAGMGGSALPGGILQALDRKSTHLNSNHTSIS